MGSHIEMYAVSHVLTSTEYADLCEWLSSHFIYAAILSSKMVFYEMYFFKF